MLSIFTGPHTPILHVHLPIRPYPPSPLVHPPLTSIATDSPAHILHTYFILTCPPPMSLSRLIHIQSPLVHLHLCLISMPHAHWQSYTSYTKLHPFLSSYLSAYSYILNSRWSTFSISPVGSHHLVASVHWVLSAISLGPPADTTLNRAQALLNPTPSLTVSLHSP